MCQKIFVEGKEFIPTLPCNCYFFSKGKDSDEIRREFVNFLGKIVKEKGLKENTYEIKVIITMEMPSKNF